MTSFAPAFYPAQAPRGARVAAELAFRLLRWARAAWPVSTRVAVDPRAVEAAALRRYAAEMELGGNLTFAADLYAAADRHELGVHAER